LNGPEEPAMIHQWFFTMIAILVRGLFVRAEVVSTKVGNTSYRVGTGFSETTTGGGRKQTARKVVGDAGLGAIIGGIAGESKGAGIGALVGVAGGTLIAATDQLHFKVHPRPVRNFD